MPRTAPGKCCISFSASDPDGNSPRPRTAFAPCPECYGLDPLTPVPWLLPPDAAQGLLPPEWLAGYQMVQRELAHLDRKQDARARHLEKLRNRSITKSLRHHPKYKRRDGRS
jgi:hypothetical protein